jgi:ribonucleotide monophosphatase NagD (HAD superfamily)
MTGTLDTFQLRPGIDGLLRTLKDRGLVLVAVGRLPERPELAGLFERDTGMAPHECVFVGDRLDMDIAPAKERGLRTIQFRSGRCRRQRPRSAAETPDAVVTDVRELEEELARLTG